MVEAVEQEFGKYRLLERVATGGMAEVFRAKTSGVGNFEKVVAIKRLHAHYSKDVEFIKMLLDEARIAAVLSHAAVAQIYDVGQVGSHYFIAMEFIHGPSSYGLLKKVYARKTHVPIALACYIAAEVAGALHHAHTRRYDNGRAMEIVHRDISPQNVLLSYEGDVKVVDFGIAKAALRSSKTRTGVIKGKFYYMAPEQARGERVDLRCDIFAAGILLYELLTTRPCYDEEDKGILLDKVKTAEYEPPSRYRSGLSPRLLAILSKAMAADPNDRYQTAQDFAWDLTRFLKSAGLHPTRLHLQKYLDNIFFNANEGDTEDQGELVVEPVEAKPPPEPAPEKIASRKKPSRRSEMDGEEVTKIDGGRKGGFSDVKTHARSADEDRYRNALKWVLGVAVLLALANLMLWLTG